MKILSKFFYKWYKLNKRDFPWRKEISHYKIFITEILLRKTNANNVSKVWKEFFIYYPNFLLLSKANNRKLFSIISCLGLGNKRVLTLKNSADIILKQFKGKIPNNYYDLIKISNIGDYSANAYLCFALKKNVAIVDNNVLRLISRYFGVNKQKDLRRNYEIMEIAKKILPKISNNIVAHNYGLLDFSAIICTSKKPKCIICPINSNCKYYKTNEAI